MVDMTPLQQEMQMHSRLVRAIFDYPGSQAERGLHRRGERAAVPVAPADGYRLSCGARVGTACEVNAQTLRNGTKNAPAA